MRQLDASRLQSIQCPRCAYQAASLIDLETHGLHAHARAKEARPHLSTQERYQGLRPSVQPEEPVAAGQWLSALTIPEPDPTFWVERHVSRFLDAMGRRLQDGDVVNVLLVGPTGTGKSSLPQEFAAAWRRPFFSMHCQLVTEQGDWWGTREMSMERGTYFQKAALLDAVETPGCVILLDEANRTHPENLNALFGFLDHRRRAWIPTLQREVAVAPGVAFFVTLNEGGDYVGTNAVDRALRDRLSGTVRLGYLPMEVESSLLVRRTWIDERIAKGLSEFANTVRHNPKLGISVSTRQLLECAALVKEGLPLQDAVLFSISNGAVEDVSEKALLQALQLTGSVEEVYQGRWWDEEDEE